MTKCLNDERSQRRYKRRSVGVFDARKGWNEGEEGAGGGGGTEGRRERERSGIIGKKMGK